jgi:hypothetical protein
MKNLFLIAIAAVLMAAALSARATIITQGTNTYSGDFNGTFYPSYQLTIAYEVTENNSDVYTYDYTLTTTPAEDLTSFTIGGMNDPINTNTMGNLIYGMASPLGSGIRSNSVIWEWGFNSSVSSDTVGFTSDLPPSLVSFTANDDDLEWSSPALIPAPVPEPSTYALLAGAALVFGFLKFRRPAKLQPQKISRRS